MVHTKIHIIHYAYSHDIRVSDRAARREKHAFAPIYAGSRIRSGCHWSRRFKSALVLAVQLQFRPGQSSPRRSRHCPHPNHLVRRGRRSSALGGHRFDRMKVVGFGMLLFVAAIQAIPEELTEAAMVDGASYWQRVVRITLPLTYKTILLVSLVSVIGSLLAFDQFFLMTAGQPFNRTASLVFWIYLNSFPYLKLGYGAALSLLLAAMVLVFTIIQLILTQRSRM